MSENAEEIKVSDENSVVDEFFGGQNDHSRGTDDNADALKEQKPDAPEGKPEDSAKKNEPDSAALKQEIEQLNKRLHDTQAAMHKATGERAELQKQLDELRRKEEDDEDWFSEDDSKKKKQIEEQIKNSDSEINDLNAQSNSIEQKASEAIWDAAVEEFKVKHNDFEEVVYQNFVPKIDQSSGKFDARVQRMFNELPDKSPAGVYTFAKNIDDILLMQDNPEAYRKKIRDEIMNEDNAVTGKAGLDLINSADVPVDYSRAGMDSAVDDFFNKRKS